MRSADAADRGFALPIVSDEDVNWVWRVLGLKTSAPRAGDPQVEILKVNSTLDVEACPGSGKTTLVVAKLAILARHWTERRRGVCVLSHTNVARNEIERRLGHVAEGKRLLSYPHYVGTIHGFVNDFIALPWLRSKRLRVQRIDDELAQDRRWRQLSIGTRLALEKRHKGREVLQLCTPDFGVGQIPWGRKGGMLGHHTPTYREIQAVVKKSCREGYFRYDEMFVWANDLLDRYPVVRVAIRSRFPVVFVDEVQDNRELQSALLSRLFGEDGEPPIVRQRFGDANQGIYEHFHQEGAETDPFPAAHCRRDLMASHRFGSAIALLANRVAPEPQGLVGKGPSLPSLPDGAQPHAIFLFDDAHLPSVLPTYARYLLELFSPEALQVGPFTAVGAVHRPSDDDTKLPRSVTHYWPDYEHSLGGAEPRPTTFLDYVIVGSRLAHAASATHPLVESVADGLLRAASLTRSPIADGQRRRKHRHVLRLLSDRDVEKGAYLDLLRSLIAEPLRAPDRIRESAEQLTSIVAAITGAAPSSEVQGFLAMAAGEEGYDKERRPRGDNIFRYPRAAPGVHIRVGSIHSVKGETHKATLVLETHYHKHNLEALKPWLLGQKTGVKGVTDRMVSRLRLHYVAMTRPSHLLCLAMRRESFSDKDISQLKAAGWRVGRVGESGPSWL